jgi:hypothetical protein
MISNAPETHPRVFTLGASSATTLESIRGSSPEDDEPAETQKPQTSTLSTFSSVHKVYSFFDAVALPATFAELAVSPTNRYGGAWKITESLAFYLCCWAP